MHKVPSSCDPSSHHVQTLLQPFLRWPSFRDCHRSEGSFPPAGKKRYYLALDNTAQGNYSSNVAFYFVYMITYWLLFSYLVPISLFVTIEIVKFVQVTWLCNARPPPPPRARHTRARLKRHA